MGLFDKLVGAAKEKAAEVATGKIKESLDSALKKQGLDLGGLMDSLKKDKEEKEERPVQAAAPAPEAEYPEYCPPQLFKKRNGPVTPLAGALGSDVEDRGSAEYIADVLRKNFPGLEVLEDQPLSAVTEDLPPRYTGIDVLVRRNGAPVAAILLVGKNRYRREAVILTMNACEQAGVPALRFMKEFSNEPAYVAGRVKGLL